jgi:hypothetical protein
VYLKLDHIEIKRLTTRTLVALAAVKQGRDKRVRERAEWNSGQPGDPMGIDTPKASPRAYKLPSYVRNVRRLEERCRSADYLKHRGALEIPWREVSVVRRGGWTRPHLNGQNRISDQRKRVRQQAAADEPRGTVLNCVRR